MSTYFVKNLPSAVREAGRALLCDASALAFLLAPAAAFIVLVPVVRRLSFPRGAYLAFASACLALFAALFLAAGRSVLPAVALSLAAWAVYTALCGVLCLIRPKRREEGRRHKKRGEKRAEEEEEPSPVSPLPPPPVPALPRKVRCFSQGERVVVGEDVRLGHVFSVLERLRALPLGAGDRLEAQKAEDLLAVYRGKGELSAEEARALNDVLAALLKMLAKYEN